MKLLLTSAGISNPAIEAALTGLLGKPVAEATALFIPTAIYAIPNGPAIARQVIDGTLGAPFCALGWKSLGILELTTLPTIDRALWTAKLDETDALLVGGGDCQYLTYWMQQSGLADMLPALLQRTVYVGLSAGSMIMTRFGTTFGRHTLPDETPRALGLLDIALHPHLDHAWFPENASASLEQLASTLPWPSYAIDDDTAIRVVGNTIDVVSEGNWKRFG